MRKFKNGASLGAQLRKNKEEQKKISALLKLSAETLLSLQTNNEEEVSSKTAANLQLKIVCLESRPAIQTDASKAAWMLLEASEAATQHPVMQQYAAYHNELNELVNEADHIRQKIKSQRCREDIVEKMKKEEEVNLDDLDNFDLGFGDSDESPKQEETQMTLGQALEKLMNDLKDHSDSLR